MRFGGKLNDEEKVKLLIKSDAESSSNVSQPPLQASLCQVAVFLSGRGSNFTALARYAQERTQEGKASFRINHVFSDNPSAGGLISAAELGIPCTVLERRSFSSKAELFQAYQRAILDAGCELIILAGFMRLLPPEFIDAFAGKIVNIHPALLPKFPGLHTHQRALAEGVSEHGCTVHFVDSGMDTGPIIAQAAVTVSEQDTEESLAAKVLALEHRIFPWVIHQIALGRIWLETDRVSYDSSVIDNSSVIYNSPASYNGAVNFNSTINFNSTVNVNSTVSYARGVKEEITAQGWLLPNPV